MKKVCTFMALLAVLFLYTGSSFATGLLTEDFNSPTGTVLVGTNGWVNHSTGINPITITNTGGANGLTYTGVTGSGIGLSVTLANNGEDDNKPLSSPVTSGSVYYSALINVASAKTGADYFMHFGTSTTSFYGRLYIKNSGAGFVLSATTSSTAPTTNFTATPLTFGQTYLVVVKYTFNTGTTTDDNVLLWVNPALQVTEPTADLTSTGNGTDASTISWLGLRQGSTGSAPVVTVDCMKAGTTWGDVIPVTVPVMIATPGTIATGFDYVVTHGPSATPQSYTLSGTNLTPASGNLTVTPPATGHYAISVDGGTNYFTTAQTIAYTGGALASTTVKVRLVAGLGIGDYNNEVVANTGGGATEQDVTVSGSVTAAQVLSASVPTLTGFNYIHAGGPSTAQSYTLTGSNLTPASGNITVTPPVTGDYEASVDGGTSYSASAQTFGYTGGACSKVLYVRLKAGLSAGSFNSEIVKHTGGGAAEEDVTCSGTVTANTLTVAPTTFSGLSYVLGSGPSFTGTLSVSGSNLYPAAGNITVNGSAHFEVSVDSIAWGTGKTIAYTANTLASTKVYVRLVSGLGIGTYNGETASFTGGGTSQNVTYNGFVSAAGLLLAEDFNYSAATTLNTTATTGWVITGAGGANPITVTSPGLSYSGYAGASVGNAVTLTTSGEDCNKQFAAVQSGSLYASAVVNVTGALATGDYFFHFGDNGSSLFTARAMIRKNGTGFDFGISKLTNATNTTPSAPVWTPIGTPYTLGTYLVVIKYQWVAGTTNDVVSLFVNPIPGAAEPSATISSTDALAGNDQITISGIFLRQGSSTQSANARIDGILVGQNWGDVTPAAGCTLNLTAFLEGPTNAGGTAMRNDFWPIAVTVELHDGTTLALVESKTGTLSTAGLGSFTFTTAANGTPYYIVVKSDNTVETWSANAESFTAGSLSYNFSTAAAQAYGSNMVQKGTKWCIYSGDVVKDGTRIVDGSDVIAIDNDNTYGVTTSAITDVTGDGIVDGSDVINVDNNNTYGISRQAPGGAPMAKRVMRPGITQKQNIK